LRPTVVLGSRDKAVASNRYFYPFKANRRVFKLKACLKISCHTAIEKKR